MAPPVPEEAPVRPVRAVSAGLADVALSSLGTFGIGLYAARELPATDLGAYAVFFSAFILVSTVAENLLLVPGEVAMLGVERMRRPSLLARTLGVGLPVSTVVSASAMLVAMLVATEAGRGDLIALAVTATVSSALSPLQDHVRRTLHMAAASWSAALVSGTQLTTVLVAVVACRVADVPAVWVPFGALGAANVVSLLVGIALASRAPRVEVVERRRLIQLRMLLRSGRWLLVAGVAPSLGGFIATVVITRLAGAAAMGTAEAARTIAMPVLVLGMGLRASLGPRLMEAGSARDDAAARPVVRAFNGLVITAGLLYAGAVSVRWVGNPLGLLVPQAYALPGIAPLTVLAFIPAGLAYSYRSILVGAGEEREIARLEVGTAVGAVVLAWAAIVMGAYARPLTALAPGLLLVLLLRSRQHRTLRGAGALDVGAPLAAPRSGTDRSSRR